MSSKFVKKLKKDLKKSPGKAAVLALLSVVAIWFWAPLAMKLLGGASEPAATLATLQPSKTISTPSAAVPTLQTTAPSWKSLAAAIDDDPRMKPAARLVLPRDPFLPSEPEKPQEAVAVVKPAARPAPVDVPPAEVGLVLSGTIVGPSRSVARLNGKSYAPGDLVRAPKSQTPLSYRVVEVSGRSVTLALGEKQYELKMPRRRSGTTLDAQNDAQDDVQNGATDFTSSDSPDFDPAILESLN